MIFFSYLFMKICILGVPVIFLQFLVEYFRLRNIKVLPFKTGHLLYIVIAVWLLLEWVNRTKTSIGFLIGSNFGIVILFSVEMLCVWYLLVRMYAKYRQTPHGSLLKYMIFGNVGAFAPFIILYILPLALLGKQLVEAGVAASFFSRFAVNLHVSGCLQAVVGY